MCRKKCRTKLSRIEKYVTIHIKDKMKNTPAYFIALFALTMCQSLSAQSSVNEDRAHCNQVDTQIREIKTYMDDDKRQVFFDQLISEIAFLRLALSEKQTRAPRNFLLTCLQKKRSAFNLNLSNATGALRNKAENLERLAKYNQEMGQTAEALAFYKKAMEKRPESWELQLQYFDLYFEISARKIADMPEGKLKNQEKAELEKEMNRIMDPLLRSESATTNQRRVALLAKSAFYQNQNNLDKATPYLEELNKLDPSNTSVIEQLLTYYLQRGRMQPALALFDQLFRLQPNNRIMGLQYAYQLIDLQNYTRASVVTKTLVDHHPRDPDVLAMRGLSLIKAGRHEEGQSFIKSALGKQQSATVWINIVRAHLAHAKGVEFQERKLPSNALREFNQASEYLEDVKQSPHAFGLMQSINTQRALIIYTFLQDNGFPKTDAAKTDAAKIVEILTPLILKDPKSQQSRFFVNMFFHSLNMSSIQNKKGYCTQATKAGVVLAISPEASQLCL